MSADALAHRAQTIGKQALAEFNRLLSPPQTMENLRAAKRTMAEAQRDLRDVKRQLTEEERSVRLQAQQARAKAAGTGRVLGTMGDSKTRGMLARGRSLSRQKITSREAQAVAPYHNVKAAIDRALNDLQRLKEQVESGIEKNKDVARITRKPPAPATDPKTSPPSIADELAKFAKLRDQGILSAEEFEEQKARLLDKSSPN
jgi:hypothetical protein